MNICESYPGTHALPVIGFVYARRASSALFLPSLSVRRHIESNYSKYPPAKPGDIYCRQAANGGYYQQQSLRNLEPLRLAAEICGNLV